MTQTISNPTVEAFVPAWVEKYCMALTENYKQYHIRSMQTMAAREGSSRYANEQLEAIKNGSAKLMKFRANEGKKYYKIIQQEARNEQGEYRDQSVTAFIDKKTGQIYKPAGWAKPAKHVRYDMRIINQREFVHNPVNVDWSGGHLYMR
tara:strand:- start:141 stop:587 length:447 start_codon:yes stop_codon:yes gene_type:complete